MLKTEELKRKIEKCPQMENVHLRTGPKWTSHGITLIALIITIIILLILAGITIGTITGNNGLINQAGEAKEEAEIASEKEVIDNATIDSMGQNKYGNLEEEEFQNALDKQAGEGKTTVTDIGGGFEVFFTDSKRYYEVDSNGNIGDILVAVTDPYPGDITKDENGNTLTGDSEANAYQINCIEDLVAYSNMVNRSGKYFINGQLTEASGISATFMQGKYVVLMTDLNFKSNASYIDSKRTDFGDINGDASDGNALITEMTTGTGFTPIAKIEGNPGNFNGNNHKVDNIYVNSSSYAGLFGRMTGEGTIKNLEISGKIKGGNCSGGIIGEAYSKVTIENCINNTTVTGGQAVGGITGYISTLELAAYSSISNCKNYGNLTMSTTLNIPYAGIGGIIGTNNGLDVKIENCENYAKIENGITTTGGIIGCINSPITINNNKNYAEIQTTSSSSGGIVGLYREGEKVEIYNNSNFGNIEGANVGGITGRCDLPSYNSIGSCYIENCYNTGNINATNRAGGIIGQIGGYAYKELNVYINNCYNIGNISGTTKGGAVGGINNNGWGQKAQYLYTNNVYYLSTIAEKGIGSGTVDGGEISAIDNVNTEEFVDILNSYKKENETEYPAGWKKWKLGEEGYPQMDI